MTSIRRTTSRRRRRIRLRSVAVPFDFVTVKPIRIGPESSRPRPCQVKAVELTRAPLATARKSARCLSRSMIGTPEVACSQALRRLFLRRSDACFSGAQTLAASRTARGEDLAAAGGCKAGAEAVTALAHQFAGLISPLHGSFSADRGKFAC